MHACLPDADGYGISGNARSALLDAVVLWGTMDDVRWRNGQHQSKKACYCVKDTVADYGYDDQVTVIASTCTEEGYTTNVYAICQRSIIKDNTKPLGTSGSKVE